MAPFSTNLPAPSDLEKDTILSQVAMMDFKGEGVNPGDLRPFYPGVGWDVINQRLYALVDEGRLSRKMRTPPGGKVLLEYYQVVSNPPVA